MFYPGGQEYMRIHRAYTWLAQRLADKGFHVLRFDYRGQGNSTGTFAEATIAQWREDGVHAIAELQAISGCEQIALVGTRLGASIAASLCQQDQVRRLVLWEPRTLGRLFVQEMQTEIATNQWPEANFKASDGTTHINGFGFSGAMIDQMGGIDITPEQLFALEAVLTITSVAGMEFSQLLEPLRSAGVHCNEHFAPGPTDWNRVDGIGGIFLPQRILHDVCDWLDGAAQ